MLAYRYRHSLPDVHDLYWPFLATTLVLFGISDWIEVLVSDSFLEPGREWLYFYKISCVVLLVGAALFYIYRRSIGAARQ